MVSYKSGSAHPQTASSGSEPKAGAIMTSPVRTCDEDQFLEAAIKEMINL
jgi:hypothetical protein